jgi:hypothetical protein
VHFKGLKFLTETKSNYHFPGQGYKKPLKVRNLRTLKGISNPWPVIPQLDMVSVRNFRPLKCTCVGILYGHLNIKKYWHICNNSLCNKNTKSNALYIEGKPLTITSFKTLQGDPTAHQKVLLLDMRVRWSSTLVMMQRGFDLRVVCGFAVILLHIY